MVSLITGASGHIGSNLVRALLERGENVRVMVHESTAGLAGLDVERCAGDVRDPASVARAVHGTEVVYHLAGRVSITDDDSAEVHAVNVEGTRNVADACLKAGIRRLVHFSSIHAIQSEPRGEPVDETRGLNKGRGLPCYDRSKAAGEAEVMARVVQGLDAVVVNPTGVLGPHDYELSAMGQVLLNLYHGRLLGLVHGGFDWVDARDVAAGAIAAARSGRRGERYLLSNRRYMLAEVAALVEQITGKRAPRLVVPLWLAYAGVPFARLYAKLTHRPQLLTRAALLAVHNHLDVRHDKATRELDYAPRPLRDTIADAFRWFDDAGLLNPQSAHTRLAERERLT